MFIVHGTDHESTSLRKRQFHACVVNFSHLLYLHAYHGMTMKSTEGMFLDHDITVGTDLYATCVTGKNRTHYYMYIA